MTAPWARSNAPQLIYLSQHNKPPSPFALEIVEDLKAALAQFESIEEGLSTDE
jgi:hypothetical protein